MNGTVRRMPGWLVGLAVAAAGMVVAAPGTPAYACGEQTWAASADSAGLQRTAVATGLPSVQVRGGPVTVPAGGAAPFSVTVVNTGGRFAGSIDLEVRTSGPAGLPAMTMELAVDGEHTVTWKRLAEEGTPGTRWFTVHGLSFQAGEVSTGFRLGLPPKALGTRLRITAHVRDSAGRQVGATTFDATVTDAAVRVRGTFPAELQRGAAYHEFDVEVHNPSTRTYHNIRATLSMTGLSDVPTPPEAGSRPAAASRPSCGRTACTSRRTARPSRPAPPGRCTCASGSPIHRRPSHTRRRTRCTPDRPETSTHSAASAEPS